MRVGAVEVAAERHARPIVEVRAVDDERVALPVADGVAEPEADARWQMRPSVHRHDARDVLRGVDDERVAREHVLLRELVDAADVVELAVADLIFVAIGIVAAAVALLERPRLIGDDAVLRIDDQGLPAEHAESRRMFLEDDGVRDAAGRAVERAAQVRVSVGAARDRSRLCRTGTLGAVDAGEAARTSELSRRRNRGGDGDRHGQ